MIIIPDGTRTMPMPLMFQLLQQEVGTRASACDYLVALGTHQPMSEEQLGQLLGSPLVSGMCGSARVFNHRWDLSETFADVGEITADQVHSISGGLLSEAIHIKINRMLLDYDQILICGPVFPHEVVGLLGRQQVSLSRLKHRRNDSPHPLAWRTNWKLQHHRDVYDAGPHS